jgi:hypothetical protein
MDTEESVGFFILSELVDVPFRNTIFDKVIKYYINAYEQHKPFEEINNITHIEDEEVKKVLIDIQSMHYELSPNWLDKHEIIVKESNRTYKTDVHSVLNRYKYLKLMETIKHVDEKIKMAEEEKEEEALYAAFLKKIQLLDARNKLAKEIGTVTHPY